MNPCLLEQVVNAVLYEGYILYPYRASTIKNMRGRFTFGRVYPRDYSENQNGAEPCLSQTECLLRLQNEPASLEITVGFLQPMWREVGCLAETGFRRLERLVIGEKVYEPWQEAIERKITVSLGPLNAAKKAQISTPFSLAASCTVESLNDPNNASSAIRRRTEAIAGLVEAEASPLGGEIFKIIVRVANVTPMTSSQCEDQDDVIMRTLASTHTILHCTGAEFISLLEPETEYAAFAADCKNTGVWPVLIGDPQKAERDTMLSSPIILYDYQQIAAESNGSFFDGLEIDELLTLRVMTLTDSEKREMRNVDEYARKILERSETASADDFLKMHGAMRGKKNLEEFFNPGSPLQSVKLAGYELKKGSRVLIRPKRRADAIDMILAGKIGIVEAIEQDAEDGIHLALVLEDDPGQDMGMARQSGHRFFYSLEEVEPLTEALV